VRKIAAISLAVVLVVALLVVAGCSSGGSTSSTPNGKTTSSGSSEAQKILTDSNKKMTSITSVKASGGIKGNMTSSSATGGNEALSMALTMNLDISDPKSPKGVMTTKGMGEDMTIYLDNGFAYVNVPGTGWTKTPIGSSGLTSATPSEIEKFAEGAQNLRIVSQTGNTYKIAFDVGPKYFEQQLKSQGTTEGLTKEMQDYVNEIVKNAKMSAVFTINKSTLYLEAVNMKIAMNMQSLGSVDMQMALAFSDYNKPVSVALPPEAANAPTVENPGATGLPSFPGLGL